MTARARKAAGRRGGKAKTPAKRAAARKNGEKGGRPEKDRHLEDFDDLGKPPDHPLRAAHWLSKMLMRDIWRHTHGRGDDRLSIHLRATAAAIAKIMPMDVMVEAQRIIEKEQGRLTQDAGPGTVRAEALDGPKKSIGR